MNYCLLTHAEPAGTTESDREVRRIRFRVLADKTAAAARFGTPKMDETALREALGLPAAVEQMSLF